MSAHTPLPLKTSQSSGAFVGTRQKRRHETFEREPLVPPGPEWMQRGACVGLPHEITDPLFFADKPVAGTLAKAQKICAPCEVKQECLDYARETKSFGVWGGVMHRPLLTEQKLSDNDVRNVRTMLASGDRPADVARIYDVSPQYISDIHYGRSRTDVA